MIIMIIIIIRLGPPIHDCGGCHGCCGALGGGVPSPPGAAVPARARRRDVRRPREVGGAPRNLAPTGVREKKHSSGEEDPWTI